MAILGELGNEDEGLLYEVDDHGREELVRSVESTHRVFIRYTNVTSRPVNIWWRDYSGRRRFYACLKPSEFCDINTFATHPWEFTDVATGERFNIGPQAIFRAPVRQDARFRSNWNISVSLRSLRDTALLQVALSVSDPRQVDSLGLPRTLSEDVKQLTQVIQVSKQTHRDP
ncbi:protein Vhl [Leguminivora glycinivorella]|uniref:protein Vhl n=1 Tax=Leguminivora glycinivorella TaxID=1035111 RepID=UPI00200BC519|nr:protein Vhl [Leguminivora glycinivorella]